MTSNITQQIDQYRELIKQRIQSGNVRLPILPKVAGEVIKLTDKSEINFNELSSLILKDQVLAGHVLKIANSPAYSGTSPVTTLRDASTRLGAKLLAKTILSVSLKSDLFIVNGYEKLIKELWNHSLASSLYANVIAGLSNNNSGPSFAAGLLHSVGMPMVLQLVSEFSSRKNIAGDDDISKRLIAEFNPVFTKIIIKKWNLPPVIEMATLNYSKYKTVKLFKEECAITYLANNLSIWLHDERSFHATKLINDPVLAFLGLSPKDMDTLLEKKQLILEQIESMSF